MKMISWNCHHSSPDKVTKLLSLHPDIAVIPECAKAEIDGLANRGMSAFWTGDLESKGLGVFGQNGWGLTPLAQLGNTQCVAAFEVSGKANFTLIAVWPVAKGYAKYVKAVRDAIAANPAWFSARPVVLAGDFNSSSVWDRECGSENHSSLVAELSARGLESVYHAKTGETQGFESNPTYHHQWNVEKRFHIDYVFVPKEWLPTISEFSIGAEAEWSKVSDHLPLIVEFGDLPC